MSDPSDGWYVSGQDNQPAGPVGNRRAAVGGQQFSIGKRPDSARRFLPAFRLPGRSQARPAEQWPPRPPGVLSEVPP